MVSTLDDFPHVVHHVLFDIIMYIVYVYFSHLFLTNCVNIKNTYKIVHFPNNNKKKKL